MAGRLPASALSASASFLVKYSIHSRSCISYVPRPLRTVSVIRSGLGLPPSCPLFPRLQGRPAHDAYGESRKGLGRARTAAERKRVHQAINEWADGEAVGDGRTPTQNFFEAEDVCSECVVDGSTRLAPSFLIRR